MQSPREEAQYSAIEYSAIEYSAIEYWACGASPRSASVALRGALLLVTACVHSAEASVLVRMDGIEL